MRMGYAVVVQIVVKPVSVAIVAVVMRCAAVVGEVMESIAVVMIFVVVSTCCATEECKAEC